MKKLPLISVMVATYNQKNVVEQTLQSITVQSYENIEIIISDDCSSDGTQSILTHFAESNLKVLLFLQEENLGITENYNFLARKCSGKYVVTFSGDDVMLPNKIARQVEALEADEGSSFCHHAVTILDYYSNIPGKILTRKYENNITTIHDVLRNFGIPGSMAVMYRRSAVKDPAFEPGIPVASDWFHIIELAMAGRGIYIDESLCFYRQDSEYNGKDPSSYENDFLKTIEMTRSIYAMPGDAVDKSCDYALCRYSLGAGYRRLIRGERLKARSLFRTAMAERKLTILAILLYGCSYFLVNPRILAQIKRVVRF